MVAADDLCPDDAILEKFNANLFFGDQSWFEGFVIKWSEVSNVLSYVLILFYLLELWWDWLALTEGETLASLRVLTLQEALPSCVALLTPGM